MRSAILGAQLVSFKNGLFSASVMHKLVKEFLTTRSLAQVMSGAVAFHGCQAVFDSLAAREGVVVPIPAFALLFLFALISSVTFIFLTIAWYTWSVIHYPYPEINLIIGSIILIPVYFELASHTIYDPRPIVVRASLVICTVPNHSHVSANNVDVLRRF